jgi:four helix bundle protein
MQNEKVEQVKSQKIYDIRKRTYVFAINIINFIREMPKDFSAQIIAKQLLRSATSIGANVVEGQAGSSKKDFINFHNHALKSANETKFWLGLARDSKMFSFTDADAYLAEVNELASILAAIVLSSKNNRYKTR